MAKAMAYLISRDASLSDECFMRNLKMDLV